MKKSSLNDDENASGAGTESENRAAFCSLETKGKKVSAIRPTRAPLSKTDVRVPVSGKVSRQQKSTLEIFTDENQPEVFLPQTNANEYESIPIKSKVNRENTKIPGVWTKNKIRQKKSFPVTQTAPFEVQSDAISEVTTPRRLPELDSKALSVQKPDKESDSRSQPLEALKAMSNGLYQKPMYCKEKIYAGVEEFSFEELRCLRWRRKKQEKDNLALTEMNRKLMEEHQQMLLKNQELMRKQEEIFKQMQQQQKDITKEIKTQEPQDACLKKMQALGEGGVVLNSSNNRSGPLASSFNSSNMKTPELSINSSQNSSYQTGGSNSSFHNKKDGKKGIAAPSPTVNTKEAMILIRGLYSAPINLSKDTTIDKDAEEDPFEVQPMCSEPVRQAAPFLICEDEPEPEPEQNIPSSGITANDDKAGFKPTTRSLSPLAIDHIMSGQGAVAPSVAISLPQENKAEKKSQEMVYHLPMPDMNEITLNFPLRTQTASTPFNRMNGLPSIQISEDLNNICHQREMMATKKVVSTPFHSTTNVFCLPDIADISKISGVTCASTENTIMMEEQPLQPTLQMAVPVVVEKETNLENTNKTIVMSPIKEESNEATHSSGESRSMEPSHHSTHLRAADVTSKPNLVTNPFCRSHREKVLANLAEPLNHLDSYHVMDEHLPFMRSSISVSIGHWHGIIEKLVAKGGNGQIFKLNTECTVAVDNGVSDVAIKVQKPACPWEFYICNEIQKRLKKIPNAVDKSCFMSVEDGFFYQDGSILVNRFRKFGTLLDYVNKKQKDPSYSNVCESLAVYILIELLTIVHQLHKCHIIHGDIKPDNILIKSRIFSSNVETPQLLTLIDLGESIDMTTYPEGTMFVGKVLTSDFQCIEMKSGKPWTYQTDLFGILGTIHIILFGKYMNVYFNQGKWYASGNFQRKWNVSLWKQLFHDFLNIPSTDQLPNLMAIRDQFVDFFKSSLVKQFNMAMLTDAVKGL